MLRLAGFAFVSLSLSVLKGAAATPQLSFDLWRNHYIKNVVLFEENSILPLPGRFEASGVESVWGEVSQESPKNR